MGYGNHSPRAGKGKYVYYSKIQAYLTEQGVTGHSWVAGPTQLLEGDLSMSRTCITT